MIDAEEKEEIQQREQEQKLQISMSSVNDEAWNRLPDEPNESLPIVSKAKMPHPSRRSEFPEPEMIKVEDKESIDYYIDLAKGQPGKKLAIISKKTGAPHGNKIRWK